MGRFRGPLKLGRGGQRGVLVLVLSAATALAAALFSIVDSLDWARSPFAHIADLVHLEVRGADIYALPRAEFANEVLALEERLENSSFVTDATRVLPRREWLASGAGQAGTPADIRHTYVSPTFFSIFDVQPAIGAAFADGTGTLNPRPVVIGHSLWTARFGADPAVIGRTVDVPGGAEGESWLVTGVMAPGFDFPARTNVWVATPAHSSIRPSVPTFARLAPGMTAERLQSELRYVQVRPFIEYWRPTGADSVVYLAIGTALLVVVSWTHVAVFLLFATMERFREFGVRLALGATQRRLVREFSMQASVLALGAAAIAAVVLPGLVRAIALALPLDWTQHAPIVVTWRAWFYLIGLGIGGTALMSAIIAGVVARLDPNSLLRGHVAGAPKDASRIRLRLLTAQVVTATAFVYVASMAWMSFSNASAVPLGFRPDGLVAVKVPPNRMLPGLPADVTRRLFARHEARTTEAAATIAALPGVTHVSVAITWPMDLMAFDRMLIRTEAGPEDHFIEVRSSFVGVGAIDTLGARLIDGREPTVEEAAGGDIVRDSRTGRVVGGPGIGAAIVTASLAAQLRVFGPVIGQVVRERGLRYRITGIIDDLVVDRPDVPLPPMLFSYFPRPNSASTFLIRFSNEEIVADRQIASAMNAIWNDSGGVEVVRMREVVWRSLAEHRSRAVVLGVSSGASFALAVIGVLGAVLATVRQSSRDVAIRIVLGGGARTVAAEMFGPIAWRLLGGTVVGVLAGMFGGQVLHSAMFGVATWQLPVVGAVVMFAVGTLVVGVVAMAGTLSIRRLRDVNRVLYQQ